MATQRGELGIEGARRKRVGGRLPRQEPGIGESLGELTGRADVALQAVPVAGDRTGVGGQGGGGDMHDELHGIATMRGA